MQNSEGTESLAASKLSKFHKPQNRPSDATLSSDVATLNYLEDMALTQSMFENGTLICHGEATDFVNIIRHKRKSIQFENYPELLNQANSIENDQENNNS